MLEQQGGTDAVAIRPFADNVDTTAQEDLVRFDIDSSYISTGLQLPQSRHLDIQKLCLKAQYLSEGSRQRWARAEVWGAPQSLSKVGGSITLNTTSLLPLSVCLG